MNNLFQALQISVVHVGFHEVGTRPLVHVSQRRCLELAVEGVRVLFPLRVDIARTSQEVTESSIDEVNARCIGRISVLVRLTLLIKRNGHISGETEVARSE